MVTARKLSKTLKTVKTITPNYSEIKNSNKKQTYSSYIIYKVLLWRRLQQHRMPKAEFYFKLFINLIGRDINLRADIEWIGIKFGRTDSFAIFLLMIRPI